MTPPILTLIRDFLATAAEGVARVQKEFGGWPDLIPFSGGTTRGCFEPRVVSSFVSTRKDASSARRAGGQ